MRHGRVASWSVWASRRLWSRAAGSALKAPRYVERTGEITVLTGASSHGQGHETVFAQVVADQLGVSMEHVAIRHGDTLAIQQGVGTFASRSAVMGGGALALRNAARHRQPGRSPRICSKQRPQILCRPRAASRWLACPIRK